VKRWEVVGVINLNESAFLRELAELGVVFFFHAMLGFFFYYLVLLCTYLLFIILIVSRTDNLSELLWTTYNRRLILRDNLSEVVT
jgi:hypothetical protein